MPTSRKKAIGRMNVLREMQKARKIVRLKSLLLRKRTDRAGAPTH